MSCSIAHHYVTGFKIEVKTCAIRITVSVETPDFSENAKWVPSELEIDLFPQDRHGASNRLALLKQLSEVATAAYRAEYVNEHGIGPKDEHPLIAADEENR